MSPKAPVPTPPPQQAAPAGKAVAAKLARDDIKSYIDNFRKQFKEPGAIMHLGSPEVVMVPEVVSSDILSLDTALGVGGLPRGRIVELYGPEASGKTTLAIEFAIQVQKKYNGICHFIDAEHALDLSYAQQLGLDFDRTLLSQPGNGEEALEIAGAAARAGVDVIIIDSVAALTPKAEVEGDFGEAHMGLQARLMSQACRKLTAETNKQSIIIFINQLRMKLGLVFGNPETTTGGNALKFYASVRMDVRKGETIKDGDTMIGHKMKVKIVKNKVAIPFRTTEIPLIYGKGFDRAGDLLSLAVQHKIVEVTGSWYAFKGDRLGQGFDNAAEFIGARPEMLQEVRAVTLAAIQKA